VAEGLNLFAVVPHPP